MKNKKKRREDIILQAAGYICLIVFVISGTLLLNYWYESWQQVKLSSQLTELKHGNTGSALYVKAEPVEASTAEEDIYSIREEKPVQQVTDAIQEQEPVQSLQDTNPDYVMWLQITDTVIDYPVVQRDNSYYLKHDFYGNKNKHGTIFLDEDCEVTDPVILLHGHHMKDGTMFGSLKHYKKADYREQHKELSLELDEKKVSYEIFAGALIDLLQAERFCYEELPETEEIEAYLQSLKKVSFWYEEPQWEEGDRLVILSTCDYGTKEQRLIIAAIEKN